MVKKSQMRRNIWGNEKAFKKERLKVLMFNKKHMPSSVKKTMKYWDTKNVLIKR